jgi:hypothetical protein
MHRMFAAVVCPECAKQFSVPRADMGSPVACPWCGRTVAALPLAAPKPLSLDDAVQLPPVARHAERSRFSAGGMLLKLALVAVGSVFACGGAFLAGRLLPGCSAVGWRELAPPDGGCRITLPAEPVEESIAANPASPATRDGKRFVARSRLAGVTASVGWLELDPEKAKLTRADDVIAAEKDRRASEFGGSVAREAAVKDGPRDGRQVEFDTPSGPWTERYVYVPTGLRPRLYVVGVSGPADSPAARRVLDSFRVD